jgi:hypothetical protein
MGKKLTKICLIALVVCGLLSFLFQRYSRQAESDCALFLQGCDLSEEQLEGYGNLLGRGVSERLNEHLKAQNIEEKDRLIERYRHYDYWSALFRGVAQCALALLIIIGIRKVLTKIYVPARIYQKLWPEEYENEKMKEKRKMGTRV